MGIFRKMSNAIARFMYGRNGMDQLNFVLIFVSLIAYVAVLPIQRQSALLGGILYWAAMALWFYVIFRTFSKNLAKRRAENGKFTGWTWRMKSRRQGAKARHADKDHKYFTCKGCKTICRVPVGKGKIVITCPKCGASIHGKS